MTFQLCTQLRELGLTTGLLRASRAREPNNLDLGLVKGSPKN